MYLFLKNVLELIPKESFLSGIPEIIKCGLINDKILNLLKFNKSKLLKKYLSLKTYSPHTFIKSNFFKDDVLKIQRG